MRFRRIDNVLSPDLQTAAASTPESPPAPCSAKLWRRGLSTGSLKCNLEMYRNWYILRLEAWRRRQLPEIPYRIDRIAGGKNGCSIGCAASIKKTNTKI